MFATSGEAYSREEIEQSGEEDLDPQKVLKIFVVRDFKSKALFAHTVKCKGSDVDGLPVLTGSGPLPPLIQVAWTRLVAPHVCTSFARGGILPYSCLCLPSTSAGAAARVAAA